MMFLNILFLFKSNYHEDVERKGKDLLYTRGNSSFRKGKTYGKLF